MNRYQLKISLQGIKPLIWRRIIVNEDFLLPDLHDVIQTVMPWTDSHLHQFKKGNQCYGIPSEDDWGVVNDYSDMTISDLLHKENDKLVYEYDFGDGWEHDIVLEKILSEGSKNTPCVQYVTGKNACPPEDCGGCWGYMRILKVLQNPQDEEYESMRDWMGLEEGDEWDPSDIGFDKEDVNDELRDFD